MKKLVTIITILLMGALKLSATPVIDSLSQPLFSSDSLIANMDTQIATSYLNYDTITNKKKRLSYQNEAIKYTYKALHIYSKYNDTAGLRVSFTNLAKIYHSQKKYPQAKWFILQSNTLARAKRDVPGIISTLIELAAIKTEIKDYKLAMRDLNEALKLSTVNHYSHTESAVQQSYAMLYNNMKNYPKADIALKRHNFIEDSIRRKEEASLVAKITASDSVQNKKKIYTISNKKSFKANSSKRTASL